MSTITLNKLFASEDGEVTRILIEAGKHFTSNPITNKGLLALM